MPIRRPVSLPRTLPVAAVLLVGFGVGCADAPTGPYTPSAAVPSGLSVSLAADPSPPGTLLPPPPNLTVAASADSVVLTAVLANNCVNWSAQAGVENGALVVTVVDSMPAAGRVCTLIASVGRYRAVVRPAPSGRYDVVLRERLYSPAQAPRERELARQSVSPR